MTPSKKSTFKLKLAMGPNRYGWAYSLYDVFKVTLTGTRFKKRDAHHFITTGLKKRNNTSIDQT